jgi:hypothetical protein
MNNREHAYIRTPNQNKGNNVERERKMMEEKVSGKTMLAKKNHN